MDKLDNINSFEDFCKNGTSLNELYVKGYKTQKVPYWVKKEIWIRGARKFPSPETAFETRYILIPEYKSFSLFDSLRDLCNRVTAHEKNREETEKHVIKKELNSEISKRDIGLAVGIPSVAVLAAGGGTTL